MNPVMFGLMLTMQAALNARINPDWVSAEYPFLRAVVLEGGEAIEHHGWKWWKQQEPNMDQVRMELVDIWHFMLSHILQEHNGDIEAATKSTCDIVNSGFQAEGLPFCGKVYGYTTTPLLRRFELIIGLAVARQISIPLFFSALKDAGMSEEELVRAYVGKNTLNIFRQDYGYKDGSYIKIWDGREDNEWLTDFLQDLPISDDLPTQLYMRLHEKYDRINVPLAP